MGKSDVPTVTASAQHGSRVQSKPAPRYRARLGAVLPLCIIVALAIVCIIVAAFTSAQRANDVVAKHEKELLIKAIAYRGEWSLRTLQSVIAPDEPQNVSADLDAVLQRIGTRFKTLIDHDFILVFDGSGNLAQAMLTRSLLDSDWQLAAFRELVPLTEYLRAGNRPLPDKIVPLAGTDTSGIGTRSGAFLQMLKGRLVIIAGIAIAANDNSESANGKPAVALALQIIDEATLADTAVRLRLENLRRTGNDNAPDNDAVLTFRDVNGQTVAAFAWTPLRPGAEVFRSVIPFITIATIGFLLLAALVLRFMRNSAAAIAAGEDRLRHLALHDPLCGLPNRILFYEELDLMIVKVRDGSPSAAVLYIDLDHFKDVNDTLGHSIGDELIRSVTQRLTNSLRGGDFVARLGGDEFAVITTAASDHIMLQTIARRIIAGLCAPYMIQDHTIVIGASIGISTIEPDSNDRATDILRYADIALYRAKSEGRNRACVYDTVMDADIVRRKQLEQDLRAAIENNQLQVAYQPVVNASGERIVGVEALARWPHPERGFISPIEFIPLAESSGLIIELGEWVLRRACQDAKAWPGLSIAVNVSPVQFRQADFVEVVERIVAETEFDPHRLELELTESTLIGNLEIAESAMLRLKALGVRLALDDFGTGYSSLLYLRRFPFDKLKIDRSFVLSIEKAADAASIVHAIVSLGRGLGMKVTAEGVENAEQHLFLRAAGVHYMQGFRFGKPMDAAAITACLASPGAYRKIARDAVAAMAG